MPPSEDEVLLEMIEELGKRELAKEHLGHFVPYVTEGIHSPAPHHQIICDALDDVMNGLNDRLIIAAPPAHAKSVYTSHNFPGMWLGRKPTDKVISVGHTQPFAEDIGRKVRNLVANPRFSLLFDGLKISADSRAASRWDTTAGGSYFATGVAGAVVGRRANLLLIDDPYKSKAVAYSPAERKKISEWYFTDVVPRLLPGGAIVLIQTRWHELDLAGELLEKAEKGDIEPFKLISLQALCEDPENDPMGRQFGDALWPTQYPKSKLEEIRGGMEQEEWDALYQQRPLKASKGEVTHEWFPRYDKLPEDAIYLRCSSWDTAGTANEKSDFTVGLSAAINVKTGDIYLTDMYRERREFHRLMVEVPRFSRSRNEILMLIENRGTGTSLMQILKRQNFNVVPVSPQKVGDKEFRFELAVPWIESGKVHLPRNASWVSIFLDEVLSFPSSKNDDIVDALSQLVNHFAGKMNRRVMRPLAGA